MLPRLFKSEADIRKHQITTLKVFNDIVKEVTEGEEYEIPFVSGTNNLCLNVFLSKDFPNEKPLLKIIPVVVHPWISSDGEVTSAPGLLNFSVHSDLGRVVQAIIREFQRTPPSLRSSHIVSPSIPINGEIRASPISYPTSSPSVKRFSPPSHMFQPSYIHQSVAFPELAELSLEELQFLNENVDRQDEFLEELPLFKEQNKTLDELISNIEDLAESNLSKKDKLEELNKDLALKREEITEHTLENERLHAIYQTLSDNYAPRHIQEQLRLAAAKADRESEKVAESFLNGEIDVDKFVSDFIKVRTLGQTRKTKEEKLGQQLDLLERAGF